MRLAAALAVVAALSGAAFAVTPVDPFDEMLKVCAAKNPQGVAAAMATFGAEAMTADETDRLRAGAVFGYSLPALVVKRDGGDAGAIVPAISEYFGWRLGRATLITGGISGPDGRDPARLCVVWAPYDRFEQAMSAMGGVLAYGAPAERFDVGVSRIAAWDLADNKYQPPGVTLMTADFGGDRKPTTIQFITQ